MEQWKIEKMVKVSGTTFPGSPPYPSLLGYLIKSPALEETNGVYRYDAWQIDEFLHNADSVSI